MPVRKNACIFAVLLGLRTLPATANSVALRLEDVRTRARERAVEVLRARSEAAQAALRAEGVAKVLRANPRLQADLRPPVTGGTWHDSGYAAQAELLLDVSGASSARAGELRAESALLDRTADLRALEAELEAVRSYAAVSVAALRVKSAEELMRSAETLRAAAVARRQTGATGDIDVAVAEGELAESKALLAATQRAQWSASMALRTLLDLQAGDELSLTTPMTDAPAAMSATDVLARAAAARPELKLAQAREALLRVSSDRLGRETWPQFGIYGGLDAAPVSPVFGFVGLSVELPLVLRNRGAKLAVAKAIDTEAARSAFELRQLERDVILAEQAYTQRTRELEVVLQEALPAAKRTRELVEIGWRAGRLDIFRVVASARDVARAERAYADALEGVWNERTVLARQVGTWL